MPTLAQAGPVRSSAVREASQCRSDPGTSVYSLGVASALRAGAAVAGVDHLRAKCPRFDELQLQPVVQAWGKGGATPADHLVVWHVAHRGDFFSETLGSQPGIAFNRRQRGGKNDLGQRLPDLGELDADR